MANRATELEVKAIIDTALTASEVTPFLDTANLMVAEVLTGEGYSDALLKGIEIWLAAHFVAIRDRLPETLKTGDGTIKYQGKTDTGLNHTSYGQQVMLLDHHGVLAEVSSAKGTAEVKTIA